MNKSFCFSVIFALSICCLSAQESLYTYDFNKYKGDQQQYKKEVSKLVSAEVSRIREGISNNKSMENHFFETFSLFGKIRNEIAKKNKSEEAERFGIKRNAVGTAYMITPLSIQYEKYGKVLFHKLMTLLNGTWKNTRTVCEMWDSEVVEGFQSLLTVEVLSCETVKKREKQGGFISAVILGRREKAPDIVLSTLKIVKKNPSTGAIEKEYQLSQHVLSKNTEASFAFQITKETLHFLSEEDQKFVFNQPIDDAENLLVQQIAPCFAKAIAWDGKKINEFQRTIAFFRYLFAHATPYQRGSAAIAEWIEKTLYEYHGYEIEYEQGRLIDLESFVSLTLSEFISSYFQTTIVKKLQNNNQDLKVEKRAGEGP